MADDSAAESFGKVVLGGIAGFALYLVISGLGLGGGRGEGRAEGRGAAPSPALPPLSPPRPKDDKRLSFVMIEPKLPGHPMGFRLRDGDPAKIYAIEELIARVKEGGRTDVELRTSGAVIQGPWDEARNLIKRAGITVWLGETPSGAQTHAGFWHANTRGQYGRRSS